MEFDKPKGKLYVLIGIARSGKSSIAKQWQNFDVDIRCNTLIDRSMVKRGNEENSRVVVCADDIRLALHGQPFIQTAEGVVHTVKELMIKTLLIGGNDVLVDGTHTKLEYIKDLLYIDSTADFYIVDTPPEVCKERAKETNQEYLLPVIDRMHIQLSTWKNDAFNKIEELRK